MRRPSKRCSVKTLGPVNSQSTYGMRTDDTSQRERSLIVKDPPEILITTPESLYLMLTSNAESVLPGVETVIVDEIHSLAGTKRGVHLFSTLERLERLRQRPDPDILRPGSTF